eukprot:m.57531 g.57531  ORF g.57531 m.57531 type:complete len:1069 (+) comp11236_c0_seq1:97-3303(+)
MGSGASKRQQHHAASNKGKNGKEEEVKDTSSSNAKIVGNKVETNYGDGRKDIETDGNNVISNRNNVADSNSDDSSNSNSKHNDNDKEALGHQPSDSGDESDKKKKSKKTKKKRKSGLVSVNVESQQQAADEEGGKEGKESIENANVSANEDKNADGGRSFRDEEDDSDTDIVQSAADQSESIFREFAAVIFRRANSSATGKMDMNEFDSVLRSPTLSLNIGEGDAIELFYKFNSNNNGGLTFSEFQACLNQLMCMAYSGIGSDEEWVRIGFSGDDSDALPLFFNRKSGKMTYSTPSTYIELEEDTVQDFDYFTTPDGEVVTTYVENGTRLYLDGDTWGVVDESFANSLTPLLNESFTSFDNFYANEDATGVGHNIMYSDQQHIQQYDDEHAHHKEPHKMHQQNLNVATFNTVANPLTGEDVFTCMNKEELEMRLYADPVTSQLKPIPIQWEAELPEMSSMLLELDEMFPNWTNTKEKVLALRLNNYDVSKTREWKSNELEVSGENIEVGDAAFDSIFVRNLKESHDTALNQVSDLKNNVLQLEATLESVQDEKGTLKRDLEGSRKLVERQAMRIFKLEEQLEKTENLPQTAQVSSEDVEKYEAKIRSLETQVVALHEGNNEELNKALSAKEDQLLEIQQRERELKALLKDSRKGSTAKIEKVQYEVQELKQENNLLKVELQESISAMRKIVSKLAAYNTRSSERLVVAVREEENMRQRYQSECLKRKLLYNKIQELRGNIRVFCRCRFDDRVPCVIEFVSENEILVPHPKGAKLFEFDQAYNPSTTQERVYEDTSPIITSCVDGYNVCFLAYGQTGSGKTFTMMGPPDNPGVNRRAIKELFEICDKSKDIDYTMDISLLEIYNENVFDLLAGDQKPLKIRMEETKKGKKKGKPRNYIENLIVKRVMSMDDVTNVLEEGDKNRSVAATAMNIHSSRSHLLLQLTVAGVNKVTGVTSRGKLTLCDLAGSERVGKSQATGQRLIEAAAINKSLTSLGIVFQALATKQKHIPYRNSKLTHVLADSLGGDSKTCVFINISPAESNLTETLSTLNFGSGIAKIEMGPVSRNVHK